ncbi:TPA: hypothetical protein ACT9M7_002988, partial [Legionella pneumophila]
TVTSYSKVSVRSYLIYKFFHPDLCVLYQGLHSEHDHNTSYLEQNLDYLEYPFHAPRSFGIHRLIELSQTSCYCCFAATDSLRWLGLLTSAKYLQNE